MKLETRILEFKDDTMIEVTLPEYIFDMWDKDKGFKGTVRKLLKRFPKLKSVQTNDHQ